MSLRSPPRRKTEGYNLTQKEQRTKDCPAYRVSEHRSSFAFLQRPPLVTASVLSTRPLLAKRTKGGCRLRRESTRGHDQASSLLVGQVNTEQSAEGRTVQPEQRLPSGEKDVLLQHSPPHTSRSPGCTEHQDATLSIIHHY